VRASGQRKSHQSVAAVPADLLGNGTTPLNQQAMIEARWITFLRKPPLIEQTHLKKLVGKSYSISSAKASYPGA
jgi:hypothetical protein